MPLEKIESQGKERVWGIWKITEKEDELQNLVHERISEKITHSEKRLEFFAGRVLAKLLLEKLQESFQGVTKDEFGKPFFKGSKVQLSLSHSYPYVAALVDVRKTVGIDLEQIKSKLLKIGPRVLNPIELQDAGDDKTKHCIYWCAKEALVKVHGKKDLIFSENLAITPFTLEREGNITGHILINKDKTTLPLHYLVYNNFAIVFSL